MIIGRFLLRFILVPLGAGCAILAAVLFVVVANWNRFSAVVEANRGGEEFVVALFLFGSWVTIVAAMSAAAMLTPAAARCADRRSCSRSAPGSFTSPMAASRPGSASTPWSRRASPTNFYSEPIIVVGAGIVAGFVYWAIAGWTAGFWKPMFSPPPQSQPPGQALPGAPPPQV